MWSPLIHNATCFAEVLPRLVRPLVGAWLKTDDWLSLTAYIITLDIVDEPLASESHTSLGCTLVCTCNNMVLLGIVHNFEVSHWVTQLGSKITSLKHRTYIKMRSYVTTICSFHVLLLKTVLDSMHFSIKFPCPVTLHWDNWSFIIETKKKRHTASALETSGFNAVKLSVTQCPHNFGRHNVPLFVEEYISSEVK